MLKAIEEPNSKLKFWEKKMREIDNKATDNIHTYASTRLKKLEADHKVVEDISEIKINIKDIK